MKPYYWLKKIGVILLLVLLTATIFVACEKVQPVNETPLMITEQSSTLKVHFLSVGKADCILIQDPSGSNMLIDTGDDNDAAYIYSYLIKYGVRTIDYLVLTHPHNDHIGSADMVINNFDVQKVVVASLNQMELYLNAYTAIKEKKINLIEADTKATYELGQSSFRFIGPVNLEDSDSAPDSDSALNNLSVVTQITYGESTFLFTGDILKDAEEALVETYGDQLKSDVLKVPHHGSNTSTKKAFLKAVAPTYAIVSVGNNNEDNNHPSKKVINRLKDYHIKTFKLNETGTIIAITDGINLQVEPTTTAIDLLLPPI